MILPKLPELTPIRDVTGSHVFLKAVPILFEGSRNG